MAKLKTKHMSFDYDTGKAVFAYEYDNHIFEGTAKCHEDDSDFGSELVGLKYAETRALIKYFKFRLRDCSLVLKTLNNLYRNMSTSSDFNIHSKVTKKLTSRIKEVESQIESFEYHIKELTERMKVDMDNRTKMYEKIRENRKNSAKVSEEGAVTTDNKEEVEAS